MYIVYNLHPRKDDVYAYGRIFDAYENKKEALCRCTELTLLCDVPYVDVACSRSTEAFKSHPSFSEVIWL